MGDKETHIIGSNLKYLRKLKNLTQQELANELGIQRSSIGAYEECRAAPKYPALESISNFFGISIDMLLKEDLSNYTEEELNSKDLGGPDPTGRKLRILPITLDADGRENIELVNQKASAGYLNGYADTEYIEDLPKFQLPMLGGGTFRAFEIKGDSMLPLRSGSIIIGEYLDNWLDIKDGHTYVVISEREGVVYKRVFLKDGIGEEKSLVLKSDNLAYSPYEIPLDDVREIWRAKMYMSADFPDPEMSIEKLSSIVMDLQQEVLRMKENS
ncbi:MAG: helix-turn-helix domain-containing protein [Bacteroidia bacterium]|nr:helix-turn-helix domain-containing protein [Bacteroidia bacterium]